MLKKKFHLFQIFSKLIYNNHFYLKNIFTHFECDIIRNEISIYYYDHCFNFILDYLFSFNLISVHEEVEVSLPHDVSSKLPLTVDKNGVQVSNY